MIELRGMAWEQPRGYSPLEASVQRYAADTGVNIVWDRGSLLAFGDTPLDKLAADYDILIIDHPHMGLAAVMATLAAESVGVSHARYSFDGHQLAMALDAARTVAFRHDLLSSPLPSTRDEVVALGGYERHRPVHCFAAHTHRLHLHLSNIVCQLGRAAAGSG